MMPGCNQSDCVVVLLVLTSFARKPGRSLGNEMRQQPIPLQGPSVGAFSPPHLLIQEPMMSPVPDSNKVTSKSQPATYKLLSLVIVIPLAGDSHDMLYVSVPGLAVKLKIIGGETYS